jgi:tetratricopeptide (TPR) repeat protein
MSTIAKLSKQAAQLEHDRQFDRALEVYTRLFDDAAGAAEEVDVALYNRAGDVATRVGDTAHAVKYFERAVDAYAAGGLLNNAIAVCNKLLRVAPDHAATHYTLAVLNAKQGFRGDAKHHYVEYAERMHRAGREEEAVRALSEFAALCPPGDDARDALARHLTKANRGTEVGMRLDALLAGAAPAHVDATPAPAVAAAALTTVSASGAEDERAQLVFLDVSLDRADAVEPVPGLEFTSVAEHPSSAPAVLADVPLEPTSEFDDQVDMDLATDLDVGFDVGLDVAMDAASVESTELLLEMPTQPPLEMPEPFATAPQAENTTVDAIDIEPLDFGTIDADAVVNDLPEVVDAPMADDLVLLTDDDTPEPSTAEPDTDWLVLPAVADERSVGDAPPAPASTSAEEFVDLGEWLRASEAPATTRLTTEDAQPTGDEQADFDRLLGVFKKGIARNVDADDHGIHYDLGVAFREMGLVDEAIAEFQRALRGSGDGLRVREALGQCFLDRGSPELAVPILERALTDAANGDLAVLGVVYLLGEAYARLGQVEAARTCYQRVVATDIEFRDAASRLTQLPAQTP